MFKIRGSIIENMYLMNLHSELPYRIIVTMWPKGLKLMTLDEDLSTAIHLKSQGFKTATQCQGFHGNLLHLFGLPSPQ